MALAHGSEILVSRTICEVAAGANLAFHERGTHELRGLPGSWELFRASPAPLATVTLPGSSRRPIAARSLDRADAPDGDAPAPGAQRKARSRGSLD